jgi:hypothetical protein
MPTLGDQGHRAAEAAAAALVQTEIAVEFSSPEQERTGENSKAGENDTAASAAV